MFKAYIPDRGELVHLNWYSSAGKEMQDEHYGLVLSPREFNKQSGLAMVCPTTSDVSDRDWPFAVMLKRGVLPPKQGKEVDSAILVDQTKSIDYRERSMKKVGSCPKAVLDEVTERLLAILDPQAY
jgi:mRNA-degrading endonuclease toxin of MazEF toxin-antitoxin module